MEIESRADAVAAREAILNAVADGDLTPGDAAEIFDLIKVYVRTLKASEFEDRVAALGPAARG